MRISTAVAVAMGTWLFASTAALADPAATPMPQDKSKQVQELMDRVRKTNEQLLNSAPPDVKSLVNGAVRSNVNWRKLTNAQKLAYLASFADGVASSGHLFQVLGPGKNALTESFVENLRFGNYARTHSADMVKAIDARYAKYPNSSAAGLPFIIYAAYLDVNPAAAARLAKREKERLKEIDEMRSGSPAPSSAP